MAEPVDLDRRGFFCSLSGGLCGAALLHLLALMGLSGAWPAMVHLMLFGWITAMIYAVNFHTMPVFSARDFPYPRLIWAQWAAWCAGVALATIGILSSDSMSSRTNSVSTCRINIEGATINTKR